MSVYLAGITELDRCIRPCSCRRSGILYHEKSSEFVLFTFLIRMYCLQYSRPNVDYNSSLELRTKTNRTTDIHTETHRQVDKQTDGQAQAKAEPLAAERRRTTKKTMTLRVTEKHTQRPKQTNRQNET